MGIIWYKLYRTESRPYKKVFPLLNDLLAAIALFTRLWNTTLCTAMIDLQTCLQSAAECCKIHAGWRYRLVGLTWKNRRKHFLLKLPYIE